MYECNLQDYKITRLQIGPNRGARSGAKLYQQHDDGPLRASQRESSVFVERSSCWLGGASSRWASPWALWASPWALRAKGRPVVDVLVNL